MHHVAGGEGDPLRMVARGGGDDLQLKTFLGLWQVNV